MTESEWLSCDVPRLLLNYIYPKASDRKLRLYACACCRTAWSDLSRHNSSRAVEVAERFADGREAVEELLRAGKAADAAKNRALKSGRERPDYYLLYAARSAAYGQAYDAAAAAEGFVREAYGTGEQSTGNVAPLYAALLRDIFGNPFRPVTVNHAWLAWNDAPVLRLARAVYDERHLPSGELDAQRLAVLADALEEAGAPDELVAHLRGPGPHVRGCFAVDLCLGLS